MDQIRLEAVIDDVSDHLDELKNSCSPVQAFAIYGFLRDMSDSFLKKYIDG